MKPSVRLAGVAAVAACGIALVAWWRMQGPTQPATESSSTASARHAPAPAAAPMAGTPVPSPAPVALDLPAVELPPDTWLPGNDLRDFEAAAAAGDVEAMLRVGRALRACVEPLADPRGVKMREAYEREITGLRARKVPGEGDGAWPWKNVHGRYALRAAVHADCLAIGAGRVATGLGWIERAARAGNTPAKVEYARDAFSEFENGKARWRTSTKWRDGAIWRAPG